MENYQDEISVKDLLIKLSEYRNHLFINKYKIILITCLFFSIGLAVVLNTDKTYIARLTFIVESNGKQNSQLGNLASIAGDIRLPSFMHSDATFSEKNILELIRSQKVFRSTLLNKCIIDGYSDLLVEHYINITKKRDLWVENKACSNLNFNEKITLQHDSIMHIIYDEINQDLDIDMSEDGSNIISLSFTSTNQIFAKKFSETLINEMSLMYVTYQTQQANTTLNLLLDRADSVFFELQKSEKELAKVRDINTRIIKASGRLKELQLMRDVEVLNTIYLEILKNLEVSKMRLSHMTPIIHIIDKPILPLTSAMRSSRIQMMVITFIGFFLSCIYFIFSKIIADALDS